MVSTVAIGPWPGGLNMTSNRDLSPYLANDELGSAVNIQYTREGFIESRPGFKLLQDSVINTGDPTLTLLGSIYINDQQIGVLQRVVGSSTQIFYIDGMGKSYLKTTITSVTFTSVLALNNSSATLTDQVPRGVFLFCGTGVNLCYRLEETPNFNLNVTAVKMSATLKVPKSHFSFSIKDRVILSTKNTLSLIEKEK